LAEIVEITFLHLPSHQFSPEIAKTLFTQGFGEDICKLLSSVNRMNINCPIAHVAAKVMVFDSNMFCSGSELGAFGHLYAALVVLPNFAFELRILGQ
jgi:hypothetical protein